MFSLKDFLATVKETYKTDETYTLTNNDFLMGIFGNELGDNLPLWITIQGDPNKSKSWSGFPWRNTSYNLASSQNNYFTLSSYKKDEKGRYRRTKKQFVSCHAFLLDDIGTKVPVERLILRPSWLIETSDGNYQAGYILKTPISDSEYAEKVLNAIIEAGLCDKGANSAITRNARLPFGVNGKYSPAFQCKLKAWDPQLRYSVDELVHKFELDLSDNHKSQKGRKINHPQGHEDIFIECPKENPVISALKFRGLYKNPIDVSKHDITCPWVHEHTNQVDSGTAYFEPDDIYPIGGFKCQHGHCADRHVRDLLSFLSIEAGAARMKPIIRVMPGEIPRIADKAEQELAKINRHYQRGGIIVTISSDPITKDISVKEVPRSSLLSALSSACLWEKFSFSKNGWVRIDPPDKIVAVIFDSTDYKHLNPLSGICHQPFLRADGTFSLKSGYDPLTGMYGVFDAEKFVIPDKPTKKDAERALGELQGLLSEFCFASDIDRAGTLSAFLTATIRASLPLAPMFHVKAPQIGSGKSYLCELIGAFASPKRGSPTTFPMDDDECRKLLLAEFLRAPAVIEFDNMTTDIIAHKSLCTSLTSEFLTGRVLGISKTATVSTRTLFLSSGNNVHPLADMARRCLTITLDPKTENPAMNNYANKDLVPDILKNRERFVSYALTIIRAWIVAGKPMTDCRSLGSYGVWSEYCRQPLMWLGLPDCINSIVEAMNEDPDRELLGRLLYAWRECFGLAPKMVRDVVNKSEQGSSDGKELYEVISDIAGNGKEINRLSLGRWIKRQSNRIVGNMRFVKAPGARSAEAWKVEIVE